MIEPLGYRCPKCNTEVTNPRAEHPRDIHGKVAEFRNIVQAVEVRLCAECTPKGHDGRFCHRCHDPLYPWEPDTRCGKCGGR